MIPKLIPDGPEIDPKVDPKIDQMGLNKSYNLDPNIPLRYHAERGERSEPSEAATGKQRHTRMGTCKHMGTRTYTDKYLQTQTCTDSRRQAPSYTGRDRQTYADTFFECLFLLFVGLLRFALFYK